MEAEGLACAALLSIAGCLWQDAPDTFHALGLLDDFFGDGRSVAPLELMVAAAVKAASPSTSVEAVQAAAALVLGDSFSLFSTSQLQAAATAIGPPSRGRSSYSTLYYLPLFHAQLAKACSPNLQLSTCWSVLELLYADGGGRFRGAIRRGGRLTAGAVLAVAWCVSTPPKAVANEAGCIGKIAQLAGFPPELIATEAERILRFVFQ